MSTTASDGDSLTITAAGSFAYALDTTADFVDPSSSTIYGPGAAATRSVETHCAGADDARALPETNGQLAVGTGWTNGKFGVRSYFARHPKYDLTPVFAPVFPLI
jgi:hypothetical protein